MFRRSAIFLSLIGIMSFVPAHAGRTQDSGIITNLFINDFGSIAIHLDNGFPNAVATRQCPNGDGAWAGGITDKTLKAALLMAKATKARITVTIEGCVGGGGWLRIMELSVD